MGICLRRASCDSAATLSWPRMSPDRRQGSEDHAAPQPRDLGKGGRKLHTLRADHAAMTDGLAEDMTTRSVGQGLSLDREVPVAGRQRAPTACALGNNAGRWRRDLSLPGLGDVITGSELGHVVALLRRRSGFLGTVGAVMVYYMPYHPRTRKIKQSRQNMPAHRHNYEGDLS